MSKIIDAIPLLSKDINGITGTITVEIKPTENSEKIEKAISNFFNYTSLNTVSKLEKNYLIAKIEGREGLTKFNERLKQEKILNIAKKVLIKGLRGKSIIFYLNKQVAYVNHISFCEQKNESPLGPISVEIRCDDTNQLINWLTK
ncbi:hypothetical protein DRO61_01750 [Candidatus Bathyarchaeota archaeon]|nr:MAG: hypothetical protein DRO61_01750 [Candidatus Bathyarchaeota archaeon]